MHEGDKKFKSTPWFNKTRKWEDAADLYSQAANYFKLSRKMDEAGKAYQRAAECQLHIDQKYDAATNLANAARCLRKTDPSAAVSCLKECAQLYSENGRFSMGAKIFKEIAEVCESEGDDDAAIENYKQSAEFYEGEGSPATANGCLIKAASLCAKIGKYLQAAETFEQVAKSSIESKLGQYKCKEYFLNAGICYSVTDVVAAKRALDKYQELYFPFSDSNECKLFTKMVAAIEAFDTDAFTAAVKEFDRLQRLDEWRTNLLLKIKDSINKEQDEEEGLL
eukprot:TRINITY_DN15946_c0_g1_i1.p1 TRINITY_DN15946_c0_g1~~TRINITY_DN15946_c0_g1_i1.p1  ORF type:complete len:280 (+),score=55.67 TRINITY_DN15946_c0_g1_i1:170-1009(+)